VTLSEDNKCKRQIGGPIGLAVLLTVANFATPNTTGQLVKPAVAMVTGFGYAFLTTALITGIRIIFTCSFKQKRHHCQDKIGAASTHQS